MAEKMKASYYLTETSARGVRLLAAREGRSQSAIAEQAIKAYLEQRQESIDWTRATESAFQFWENEVDAEYNDL